MANLIDYPALALKVQSVIEGTGRDIEFIRNGETESDPDKPWRTYSTTPESSITAKAVADNQAVESTEENFDIRIGDKVLYVSAKALNDVDLTLYDAVVDEGSRHEIIKAVPIKPGAVTILYIVQVRR